MENEKIIEQLQSKMQEKTKEELQEALTELISNCAKYAIRMNNCKTNWTARELLGNIFDEEKLEIFDEK